MVKTQQNQNQKTRTLHSKYTDQAKLNRLTNITILNIKDIYKYFNVEPAQGAKVYFSRCFIHGGDNKSSLNLYYNADYRIHYKCRTHLCETHFGTSLLSMIRGGLSHKRYGWKMIGDKTVSLDETVEFLLDKFGLDFNNLKDDVTFSKKDNFGKSVQILISDRPKGTFTRDFYRSKVEIPSQYFLKRGYSIEALDEFDVGICKTYKKEMFNRSTVPIYDDTGEFIVGVTGRSIFEECNKCNSYHNPDKPCYVFPKWRHSRGFQKEKILYNYSKALPFIQETATAVIVESPGNVWRLWEAGINNVLGLLGTNFNPEQKLMLAESGALSVVVLMDRDKNEAGQKAAQKIKAELERTYNVTVIELPFYGDVADMPVEDIQKYIKPTIDQITNSYKGIL